MDPLQQLVMALSGGEFPQGSMPLPQAAPPPAPALKVQGQLPVVERRARNPMELPTLTPPPGINNPLGAAALFARQAFGTPPARTPPIGQQLTNEGDVPSSSGPPSVGQTLASSPAQRPSGGESSGGYTPPDPATAPSAQVSARPGSPPEHELQKFMLQMGLSMMTPKWGGPLANIATSVGEGAEAIGRGRKEKQEGELNQRKLDLEEARINKVGRGSSSSAAKLKSKKPIDQLSENMTPEAALYFQQRLKNLKGEAEVTDAQGNVVKLSESEQFNRLMTETKAIDARTRAAAGRAKSAEINDAALSRYVGTPREVEVLNFVANDPVERALLLNRIENMKRAKAATDANASAAPKR